MLRRILSVMLAMTGVLPSGVVFAGDYTVSYAFDSARGDEFAAGEASTLNEAGTTRECWYEKYRSVSLPKADLTKTFALQRSSQHEVVVHADGGGSRSAVCCFSSGGERRVAVDLTQPLLYLRIYEGHARKRNEFIQNHPLELLYLQFSDLR